MLNTESGICKMFGMGSCNVNQVHLFIRYKLFIRAVGFFTSVFPGKDVGLYLFSGRNGIEPYAFHFVQRIGHNACYVSCPHNPDIKFSEHISLISAYAL